MDADLRQLLKATTKSYPQISLITRIKNLVLLKATATAKDLPPFGFAQGRLRAQRAQRELQLQRFCWLKGKSYC